ncbi:Sodium/calcium exchanger protein-domain-containing protein [Mycena sp. CBHHK59/15]|nr:Sodium/calcium exchanger protein-domain-containing protein [Mycena sp. CBHHK59/15]
MASQGGSISLRRWIAGCPQLRHIARSWINVLLIFCPVGIGLGVAHAHPIAVFLTCFPAIIPLAGLVSDATETISEKQRNRKWLGSFFNASNATELIISIIALFQNQTDITKLSLLGSVFSNLLVVLPTACIIGAPNFIAQNFNINSVRTHTFLLVVGAGILCLTSSAPTINSFTSSDVNALSRVMSITLILAYVIFIFIYRLWTHKKELEAEVKPSERRDSSGEKTSLLPIDIQTANPTAQEQSPVTQRTAIGVLLVATGITAGVAWFLLESVSALFNSHSPITRTFLGLIILPILGNVTEHWTAFTMAKKDKMTDSLDIALGSALQIQFFVLPAVVIVAWITGVWKPSIHMDLVFEPWQTVILFVATVSVKFILEDGSTDWLEGFGIFLIFVALATISARR